MFPEWHHAVLESAYFKVSETLKTFRMYPTSRFVYVLHWLAARLAVQNKAARYVHQDWQRTSSVTAMKDSLGWLPLQNRRLVNRLTFMHKTIHGQHGYILPPYVDKPKRPTRTHRKYNYNLIRAQTDAYLYSYLPKTIKAWNSLPNNISNTTDIDSFRTILLNDMRNGNVQVVHRSIQTRDGSTATTLF